MSSDITREDDLHVGRIILGLISGFIASNVINDRGEVYSNIVDLQAISE